jgi:hypothetical protein
MAIADGAPGPSPDEGSRRDTRGRIHAGGGAMVRRLSSIAVARPLGARLGLIFDRGLELARVRSPRRKPGASTSSSADPVFTPIRSTTFQIDAPGTRPPHRATMASPNLTPGPEACRTENDDPAGDLTRPDPRVRRRNRGEPDGVRTNTDRTGRLARCRVTVTGLQRLRAGDVMCYTGFINQARLSLAGALFGDRRWRCGSPD